MEMMGKIRRMYFRDKLSLHQIAKRTWLSRNTIRKWGAAAVCILPGSLSSPMKTMIASHERLVAVE